eukprot:TRINITY_DN20249_c0_g1_i1.p1 TRINITY_DN20249_c0_g1~~TRINITY_DN20249_c0_g1_i1.p1  ORF type:complete len:1574 (+),score=224.91 TRINITY_DN20249_c0_g1_i1:636-4724(+)
MRLRDQAVQDAQASAEASRCELLELKLDLHRSSTIPAAIHSHPPLQIAETTVAPSRVGLAAERVRVKKLEDLLDQQRQRCSELEREVADAIAGEKTAQTKLQTMADELAVQTAERSSSAAAIKELQCVVSERDSTIATLREAATMSVRHQSELQSTLKQAELDAQRELAAVTAASNGAAHQLLRGHETEMQQLRAQLREASVDAARSKSDIEMARDRLEGSSAELLRVSEQNTLLNAKLRSLELAADQLRVERDTLKSGEQEAALAAEVLQAKIARQEVEFATLRADLSDAREEMARNKAARSAEAEKEDSQRQAEQERWQQLQATAVAAEAALEHGRKRECVVGELRAELEKRDSLVEGLRAELELVQKDASAAAQLRSENSELRQALQSSPADRGTQRSTPQRSRSAAAGARVVDGAEVLSQAKAPPAHQSLQVLPLRSSSGSPGASAPGAGASVVQEAAGEVQLQQQLAAAQRQAERSVAVATAQRDDAQAHATALQGMVSKLESELQLSHRQLTELESEVQFTMECSSLSAKTETSVCTELRALLASHTATLHLLTSEAEECARIARGTCTSDDLMADLVTKTSTIASLQNQITDLQLETEEAKRQQSALSVTNRRLQAQVDSAGGSGAGVQLLLDLLREQRAAAQQALAASEAREETVAGCLAQIERYERAGVRPQLVSTDSAAPQEDGSLTELAQENSDLKSRLRELVQELLKREETVNDLRNGLTLLREKSAAQGRRSADLLSPRQLALEEAAASAEQKAALAAREAQRADEDAAAAQALQRSVTDTARQEIERLRATLHQRTMRAETLEQELLERDRTLQERVRECAVLQEDVMVLRKHLREAESERVLLSTARPKAVLVDGDEVYALESPPVFSGTGAACHSGPEARLREAHLREKSAARASAGEWLESQSPADRHQTVPTSVQLELQALSAECEELRERVAQAEGYEGTHGDGMEVLREQEAEFDTLRRGLEDRDRVIAALKEHVQDRQDDTPGHVQTCPGRDAEAVIRELQTLCYTLRDLCKRRGDVIRQLEDDCERAQTRAVKAEENARRLEAGKQAAAESCRQAESLRADAEQAAAECRRDLTEARSLLSANDKAVSGVDSVSLGWLAPTLRQVCARMQRQMPSDPLTEAAVLSVLQDYPPTSAAGRRRSSCAHPGVDGDCVAEAFGVLSTEDGTVSRSAAIEGVTSNMSVRNLLFRSGCSERDLELFAGAVAGAELDLADFEVALREAIRESTAQRECEMDELSERVGDFEERVIEAEERRMLQVDELIDAKDRITVLSKRLRRSVGESGALPGSSPDLPRRDPASPQRLSTDGLWFPAGRSQSHASPDDATSVVSLSALADAAQRGR